MGNGWGGADPAVIGDATHYELATRYRAEQLITITGIRVHAGIGANPMANRKGRVWTDVGAEIGIANMPDNLGLGWTVHPLTVPVTKNPGDMFRVSYSTFGNYSALVGSLTGDVPSSDGAVTALASGTGGIGNGLFAENLPGTFPTTGSAGTFYGIDFEYVLGAGGNTAPVISNLALTMTTPSQATVVVTATDEQTLIGATYRYDWGDGSPVTVSGLNSASHTYLISGDFPVLVSVTDAGGLSAYRAAIARPRIPVTSTDELEHQRALTQWFINADPSDVVLTPVLRVRTASGGSTYDDQPPRTTQVMRLIRMSHTQKPVIVEDGKERLIDFTLLGMWDSAMAVGDYWIEGGLKFEIVELVPFNGYERKGLVVKHGHG